MSTANHLSLIGNITRTYSAVDDLITALKLYLVFVVQTPYGRLHCDQCPSDKPLQDLQSYAYARSLVHRILDDSSYSMLSKVVEIVVMALILMYDLS